MTIKSIFWSTSPLDIIFYIDNFLMRGSIRNSKIVLLGRISIFESSELKNGFLTNSTFFLMNSFSTTLNSLYQLNHHSIIVTMYSDTDGDYVISDSIKEESHKPAVYKNFFLMLDKDTKNSFVAQLDPRQDKLHKFLFYKFETGSEESKFSPNIIKEHESGSNIEFYFFELTDDENKAYIRHPKDYRSDLPPELDLIQVSSSGVIISDTLIMIDQKYECVYTFSVSQLSSKMKDKESFEIDYQSFTFKEYFDCPTNRRRRDMSAEEADQDTNYADDYLHNYHNGNVGDDYDYHNFGRKSDTNESDSEKTGGKCKRVIAADVFLKYKEASANIGVIVVIILILLVILALIYYFCCKQSEENKDDSVLLSTNVEKSFRMADSHTKVYCTTTTKKIRHKKMVKVHIDRNKAKSNCDQQSSTQPSTENTPSKTTSMGNIQ